MPFFSKLAKKLKGDKSKDSTTVKAPTFTKREFSLGDQKAGLSLTYRFRNVDASKVSQEVVDSQRKIEAIGLENKPGKGVEEKELDSAKDAKRNKDLKAKIERSEAEEAIGERKKKDLAKEIKNVKVNGEKKEDSAKEIKKVEAKDEQKKDSAKEIKKVEAKDEIKDVKAKDEKKKDLAKEEDKLAKGLATDELNAKNQKVFVEKADSQRKKSPADEVKGEKKRALTDLADKEQKVSADEAKNEKDEDVKKRISVPGAAENNIHRSKFKTQRVARFDNDRPKDDMDMFRTVKFDRFMASPLDKLKISDIPGLGKQNNYFERKGVRSIADVFKIYKENQFNQWSDFSCFLMENFSMPTAVACQCAKAISHRMEKEDSK